MTNFCFNVGLIRLYMAKNNLSKRAMSKLCNVSHYAFNKILNNDLSVNIEAVMRVAVKMEINPARLIVCG